MTRFKFLGFLLPLAIAGGLALGLMSVPAAAHHCKGNHPTEPPCNDPNPDTDEIAHLTLGRPLVEGGPTGAMSVMALVVRVSQDSPKRLQFGDNPFSAGSEDGIVMDVDTNNCDFDPRFNSDPFSVPTKSNLQNELSSAVIEAGFLIVRIDKKNETAEFLIEYFVPETPPDPLAGRIRIFFRQDLDHTGNFGEVTFVTEDDLNFPGTDLTITGSIAIDWADAPGPDLNLNDSRVLVCDGQVMRVELNEIPL